MATTMIDTASAGNILGVNPGRIRSLIRQGLLKDYAKRNENKQKHYSRLNVSEVREFKRNNHIMKRGVAARAVHEDNGHKSPRVHIESRPVRPIESFTSRLDSIEKKLDGLSEQVETLVRLWT
jgi:hypothetical protein